MRRDLAKLGAFVALPVAVGLFGLTIQRLVSPVQSVEVEGEVLTISRTAPLGTKEELTGTLKQVLADARDMLEFAGHGKQEFIDGINVTQDQVYIRAIAVDFFISHLNTVAAWAERTLEEVAGWDNLLPTDEKNQRGLERIRQTPVDPAGETLTGIATPPTSQMRDSQTRLATS